MDLRHLEAYVALCSALHFGRAAERVYVSQSTITRQIQQIERELQVTLLERSRRRVALTPAGRTFLVHAQRMLDEMREARLALAGAAGPLQGHLVIGCFDGASIYLIPKILAALHVAHPQVVVSVATVSSRDAPRAVREGTVDAAVVVLPMPADGIQVRPLFHEELVLTLPVHHPLGALRQVPIAVLFDQPLIVSRPGQQTRRLIEGAFAAAGRAPSVAFELESVQARKDAVRAGLGVAILGKTSVLPGARGTGLLTRPLSPPIYRGIGLASRSGRTPDPLVAAFGQTALATAIQLGCKPAEDALPAGYGAPPTSTPAQRS
ncbi:MAG: LysR family transcriptional regulator [Chloroflexi bacterium]|nr:LysR family transcriptional regulator [Chloroflexota bacterium]